MNEKKNPIEIKGGFSFPIPPAAPIPVTTDAPRHAIRPNVRAALDYLDGIFARGGEDAEALWDVLSALRGPDETFEHLKKEPVTIPIRRAAFPRTTAMVADTRRQGLHHLSGVHQRAAFGNPALNYPYYGVRHIYFNTDSTDANGHFDIHGCRAAIALGLI